MSRSVARQNRKPAVLGHVVPLEDRVVPATAFALLPNNSLVAFSTDNPAAANPAVPVAGLAAGEVLVGIDFRPQNGLLYGLAVAPVPGGSAVRLYAVSARTGFATPLTPAPVQFADAAGAAVPVTGVNFAFDFNPAVDRVRVVTDTGFNFRMDPNTGGLVDGDGAAGNPVTPDGAVNPAGVAVSGAAYTNNSPNPTGAPVTTLYTLDATNNQLLIQTNPDAGTQATVGLVTLNGAPLDFSAAHGFDIPAGVDAAANNAPVTGRGFAALTAGGATRLYGIELSTGVATDLGFVAGGTSATNGLAVQSDAPAGGLPAVALSADGTRLVRFNTAAPTANAATVPVTNVAVGEVLVGVDFRPATGQLFGLGVDAAADTATLYRIDPQTGAATPIGTAGSVALVGPTGTAVDLPVASAGYGFDFNPTVDRVRVTTGTGLNFRIDPGTGLAIDGDAAAPGSQPDGAINGGVSAGVTAAAYTNSFGQPLTTTPGPTTQYTLDAASDTLFIQNPPNTGTQTNGLALTVGGAGLDFTAVNGFDIPGGVRVGAAGAAAAGRGFAALTVNGTPGLYSIDLFNATATLIGPVPADLAGGSAGLALGDGPVGVVSFSAETYSVSESAGTATITLTRTDGSAGAFTVLVTYPTAIDPSTNFVTFADGQTTATFTVPVTDDAVDGPDQILPLTLSDPTDGAVLGARTGVILTITDDDEPPPTGTVGFGARAYTVVEGGPALVVTLTRTGGSAGVLTATVTATDGTATGGADFGGLPATVTFADGQTTATVTVPILNDTLVEGDESFLLTAAPAGGGASATAGVLIQDDDVRPGTVAFAAAAYSVVEGAGSATLTLTRAGGSDGAVVVNLNVTGGSATAGADFGPAPTQVVFLAGQTTATVTVPVAADSLTESPETVVFRLSDPTNGAALGAQSTATLTITDPSVVDPPVVDPALFGFVRFTSAAVSAGEGAGTVTVTLTRSDSSTAPFTVTLSVTGGTATAGADFGSVPTQVTFADGQATATVTIPIVNDALVEGPETLVLALSNPGGGAALGTPLSATVTVTDNDTTRAPFLAGGPAGGVARLVAATGGAFALGDTVTFPGLTGTARVAVADVNGDGVPDFVGGAGPGGPSRVVVVDGKTRAVLTTFDVYEAAFTGGVFLAAADLDGDGRADVVVTPDQGGGPVVAVYSGAKLAAGVGGEAAQITRFFGIEDPAFRGGARVALGDLTGDGRADLIVSAGFLGGPRVALFNGASIAAGAAPVKLVGDFFAFEDTLRNGSFVASADVTGDGRADLIVGGGPGGGPRVRLFDGRALLAAPAFARLDDVPGAQRANFFAGDPALRGGARVAARDADGDGVAEVLVGSGDREPSRVRLYRAATLLAPTAPTPDQEFDPFGTALANGVFVG